MLILQLNRVVSSVGSEHRLDRAGVTGSSPVQRTKLNARQLRRFGHLGRTNFGQDSFLPVIPKI